MNDQHLAYQGTRFYRLKVFLFTILVVVGGTALIFLIAESQHSPTFGGIAWIALMLTLMLSGRAIRAYFSTTAVMEFDSREFKISEYKSNDNSFVKETTIPWADMKGYNFDFLKSAKSNFTATNLTIYLRNGKRQRFCFSDEKEQQESLHEKSIFSIFYYFVKQFNHGKTPGSEISLMPGFLSTGAGIALLFSVMGLSVIAIIIHSRVAPDTVYFSWIGGFFITIGIIASRVEARKIFKTISGLRALDWETLNKP
jgi:hypothetical protein